MAPLPSVARVVRTLAWALTGIFVNIYSLVLAHKWHHAAFGARPPVLPDLGFELLSLEWCPANTSLLDAVPGYFLLVSISLALLMGHFENLLRGLDMIGLCFFLRGVSILLTILPDPFAPCVIRAPYDSAFAEMLVILRESPMTVTSLCGHCLFSGHACTMTLVALVWTRIGNRPMTALSYVVLALQRVGMVACRFHYTCDVVMGVVVAWIGCRVILRLHDRAAPAKAVKAD